MRKYDTEPGKTYNSPASRDSDHKGKTRGLFHDVTSPVMMGENTSQNDNTDWSLFHRTTSDKQQTTSQLLQSDRQT
jgi:hypothetical protein